MPPPVNLPPIEQCIFETVQHHPDISAEALRRRVQADDSEDRKHLHLRIARLNTLLRPHGICVRSEGGGYHIKVVS
jgi:hypothetical protein